MRTIPENSIDPIWTRLNESPPDEIRQKFEKLGKAQPFIVAYMLAVEETLMAEGDRGNLLFLTLIIHEIMSAARPRLQQITGEVLESAESANTQFLENLEAGSEIGYIDALSKLVATYNQMPLLGAVLEALMAGNEEEPELADENLGMALIHLKTVIDCLDQ